MIPAVKILKQNTMIRFKLKLASRNLLKNKLYSSLIISGFSIGFTACILIALFYNAEHNVNSGFAKHENIYRLYDAGKNKISLDYELFPVFSEKYPEIENACPVEYSSNYHITIKDVETKKHTGIDHIISTTNSFFDVFSVEVVAGSTAKPFNALNSMVITESVAKRLYGDENPVGRQIEEEFFSGTISAVIKDLPENSTFKAELILNSENEDFQMSQECNDGVCIYPTTHFVVLNQKTAPQQLANTLNGSVRQFNTNVDSLAIQKLDDIYLSSLSEYDAHAKGNPKMLLVFLSIAILIVLLSSINYLNYSISMQFAKLKEIGINKTNGAGLGQLISNSLIEVSLGIFISLIISIVLTIVFLPYSEFLFGKEIFVAKSNLLQLAPIFSLTVFAIILLNSLAPIYVISRFNITDFLSGGRKRSGRQFGKQAMLTFQITVSIALIAVVLLIFKQLQYVKQHDLGFDQEHLVRLDLPYLHPNPSLLKSETEKLPFVLSGSLSDGHPGWIRLTMGSGEKDNHFMVNCIYVSDDYIETMGIDLLEGRNFLPGDRNKACLMNQEAIKKYAWENIENKKYKYGNESGYQVIGVVNNFNVKSLHKNIEPLVILYDPSHRFSTLSLRLTAGNVGEQLQQIGKLWKQLLPDEPMDATFYDDQFQAMYAKEEKLAKSITFFSLIAVVLTGMGILGQVFLISLRRTKEIGIRKVNGARISEILFLLNRNFVKWVVIAFIIATPIAWFAMNKWLENFAYKTELSWWIFVLAGLLALEIALLTVSWQSWKAATRNPVEALRYE